MRLTTVWHLYYTAVFFFFFGSVSSPVSQCKSSSAPEEYLLWEMIRFFIFICLCEGRRTNNIFVVGGMREETEGASK